MKLEIQLVSRNDIKNIPSFAMPPCAKAAAPHAHAAEAMRRAGRAMGWAGICPAGGTTRVYLQSANSAVSRAHQSAPFCAASPMRKPGGVVSARGVAVGEGAGAVLAGKVDRRTHAARALVHRRVVRSRSLARR